MVKDNYHGDQAQSFKVIFGLDKLLLLESLL